VPACRAEAPGLAAAARRSAAAGVRFVGVDVADNQASALAYMRHFRIGYPSVDDPGDAIVLNFHKLVPIAEFPSTLVISRDGRIAARVIGGVTYAELERLIRKSRDNRPTRNRKARPGPRLSGLANQRTG